ncbi:MAG: VOC family protein [Acidimicrobiales bacterium]
MITQLGQIEFVSPQAEAWRSFAVEVLGAQLAADGPDGSVRLRIDDIAHRIEIHPGPTDDLVCLTWVDDDRDTTEARFAAAGVDVDEHTFVDPFGFRHRLVTALTAGETFVPGRPISGFVTGEQGLGHAVLIVPDLAAAETFYSDVLGLRPSDSIESGISLRFFHCAGHAARHHTLAIAAVPGMVGMHHLMLEVGSIDDVGRALDVITTSGIPLASTLGRHTNDLMTSFYVRTPSGFEIEYGTGGITIDDDTWQITTYDAQSTWGHRTTTGDPLFPGILRPFDPAAASPAGATS